MESDPLSIMIFQDPTLQCIEYISLLRNPSIKQDTAPADQKPQLPNNTDATDIWWQQFMTTSPRIEKPNYSTIIPSTGTLVQGDHHTMTAASWLLLPLKNPA